MLGGIEAGGTKFVCAVSDHDLNIRDQVTIPTRKPEETMKEVIAFFKQYEIEAMGVGSFGPIDVKRDSETYGYITNTPKLAWQQTDVLGPLKAKFGPHIGWTTDVNAAALAEYEIGAGKGTDICVYITVGTGIGGGAVVGGHPLEGFSHPEMGHMLVRQVSNDSYQGNCPFHRNCLEGLAAGPAIFDRVGTKAQDLAEDDPLWDYVADYLAQAAHNLTMTLSPDRIILGGSVMKQSHLLAKIREKFANYLEGYVDTPDLSDYIINPGLKDKAGIMGALVLAHRAKRQ